MTAAKGGEQKPADAPKKQTKAPEPEPVAEGVYVAREHLYVDGSRAFAAGDLVPAEHINRFGWQDQVREFDDNEGED